MESAAKKEAHHTTTTTSGSRRACFVGVDVGTASARAAVISENGDALATAVHAIQIHTPQKDHHEQSSIDIWNSVCACVREAVDASGVQPSDIRGIGFDATCSLVVLNAHGEPLPITANDPGDIGESDQQGAERNLDACKDDARKHSQNGDGCVDPWNVVMWMDHRATAQAQRISATEHQVLSYIGGKMSPEMNIPKVLWLKENLPNVYRKAAHFMDLPDFLTYRATGCTSRSLCSLVCKFTYIEAAGTQRPAHCEMPAPSFGDGEDDLRSKSERVKGSVTADAPQKRPKMMDSATSSDAACVKTTSGWQWAFLESIGLEDLTHEQLGTDVRAPGQSVGHGLCQKAAEDLGLLPLTPVAVGSIDAHAGVVGGIGETAMDKEPLEHRMQLVLGTSSCHMAISQRSHFVPGVWGPYASVIIKDYWLNEGGQSASGSLIQHITHSHASFRDVKKQAEDRGVSVYKWLNDHSQRLATKRGLSSLWHLASGVHVLPFFHGNRAPLADPTFKGMISGLHLSSGDGVDDLVEIYIATLLALALETRHIISAMNEGGLSIKSLHACGGLCKNPLYLEAHATATGMPIFIDTSADAMLLGSAILAATASGHYRSIPSAMSRMTKSSAVISPLKELSKYFDKKYAVYSAMIAHQRVYNGLMASSGDT